MTPAEARLKKLSMRSWHRGIKEMDLILGHYSDDALPDMEARTLDLYEALLDENDQDLYLWVSGRQATPDRFADLMAAITAHATTRLTNNRAS